MKGSFAKLILDISHHKLDKLYTYSIPEHLYNRIEIGQVVEVEFGNSKTLRKAYVTAIEDSSDIGDLKLKPITGIAKNHTLADAKLISLALWMSKYYGCTMSKAISTVLPVKKQIKSIDASYIYMNISKEELPVTLEILSKKRRSAWIRLLKELMISSPLSYEYVRKNLKISLDTLYRMQEEKLIDIKTEAVYREPELILGSDIKEHTLNEEQSYIIDDFRNNLKNAQKPYLLFGITGSGKTLVYIEMIKEVLKQNRQVIFLVPEIGLSYQVVRELSQVFSDELAIINSGLSQGERHDQFKKVRDGAARIMVGPRTALFTPFEDIGLIIIDEEHDSAYKNESMPRYDARVVALELAGIHNAKLVLGSATPSVESYKKAMDGEYNLYKLSKRAVTGSKFAATHIVDLRKELQEGNKSIFSRKMYTMILDRLEKKEQVLLFINRRGYSNFVSCRACGDAIMCKHCDVSMTLHKDNVLRCHYCAYSMPMPDCCPSCNAKYLAGFGVGTQKLESITKKMFPKARVLRLDTDNANRKHNGDKILSSFESGEYDILIGTQMIVKGHDFSRVSLVGIMAADISLYTSNYTAAERTFALITQAAGRAGRRNMDSDVIIQTYKTEHYAIQAAARQDYESFYNAELAYRNLLLYPPAVHILSIQFACEKEDKLLAFEKAFMLKIQNLVSDYKPIIVGPVSPAIYKLYDYYRKILYIKHIQYDILKEIKLKLDEIVKEINVNSDISLLYDFT